MTWNYRVVKYANGSGFGLHRVFYNADGSEKTMSESPVSFFGKTRDEVYENLCLAKMDAMKRPIFNESANWGIDGMIKGIADAN